MPKRDVCHDQIVHALEKAGWRVDNGPFILPLPGRRPLQVDITARRVGEAEEQIVVAEIKCFTDERAELHDLYTALGQYLVYRGLLARVGVAIPLYLAVPLYPYQRLVLPLADVIREQITCKMIVVDLEQEEVVLWLD